VDIRPWFVKLHKWSRELSYGFSSASMIGRRSPHQDKRQEGNLNCGKVRLVA
jgi:hypothetical protein